MGPDDPRIKRYLIGEAVKVLDYNNPKRTRNLTVFFNKTTLDCQILIYDLKKNTVHSAHFDKSGLFPFNRECKSYIADPSDTSTLKFFDATPRAVNIVRVGRSENEGFLLLNIITDFYHSEPDNYDEKTIEIPTHILQELLNQMVPPQT